MGCFSPFHDGCRSRSHHEAYPLGGHGRPSRLLALRLTVYECRRPSGAARWRCKDCNKDFSITSGTLFASHKMPLRGYLGAIAVFCNEVKGKSMLALSRDLGLSYKTAAACRTESR